MKIKKTSIERTALGFPAEWTCKTTKNEKLKISYRFGKMKFMKNDEVVETVDGPEGDLDIGGSCEDSDLIRVLLREELLSEK
jgi:hypothetical protein